MRHAHRSSYVPASAVNVAFDSDSPRQLTAFIQGLPARCRRNLRIPHAGENRFPTIPTA